MKPIHHRPHCRLFLISVLIAGFVSFQKFTFTVRAPGIAAAPPRVEAVLASGDQNFPAVTNDAANASPVEAELPASLEAPSQEAVEPAVENPAPTMEPAESVRVALEDQPPVISTEEAPQAALAPAPDPLRFVFPTQGPKPVSAWRPPLYSTPWEPTPHDHFYFSRPIAADEVNWPLPDYRYGGVFFQDFVHTGVDIPVPVGTPVLAAGPGRVTWTGYGLLWGNEDLDDPYGLAVVIRHDFGYKGERLYTIYAHMSRIDVTEGERVETGDVLGLSGATGNVTGPHLHFEVRLGKSNFHLSRNPELWIAPPQGWGVVAARVMNESGGLLRRHEVRLRNNDTGQTWVVDTYGEGSANSDAYYQENMVIGDLPAGSYSFWIEYKGKTFKQDLQVIPGMVSYFTFHGEKGFSTEPPKKNNSTFQPPDQLEDADLE